MIPKVKQMANNQFVIHCDNGTVFQSYETPIAIRDNEGVIYLNRDYWDYSKTTGKYRNMFLGETKAETQRKINEKLYCLFVVKNREIVTL